MSEQTTLSPDRGEVITSVEPDTVFLEARNAYLLAQDALAKANQALVASSQVQSDAANAASQATTAITLATAAQTTADNAISSQVSVTGATMTGPLYLSTLSPASPYEAAAKQYVDTKVNGIVTDQISSITNLKADKTYVDSKDAGLQSQIDAGTTEVTNVKKGIIPIGGIILWSGTIANIPTGWRLCDGTNGTPDLRSRFVIGASSSGTYTVGAVGGNFTAPTNLSGTHTHTGTINPGGAHTHTVTVLGHALTINQMPKHGHSYLQYLGGISGPNGQPGGFITNSNGQFFAPYELGNANAADGQMIGARGGDAQHTHGSTCSTDGSHSHTATVNSGGEHTHTVDVRPPYYALAYIMRIA